LLAALGSSTPGPASASTILDFLFWTEPQEPYCIDSYGTFEDEWAFNSCRREVDSYVDEINRYVDCLNREQDEAIRKANEVIERFNCKANGGSFCY
jgi:hypothetical protein